MQLQSERESGTERESESGTHTNVLHLPVRLFHTHKRNTQRVLPALSFWLLLLYLKVCKKNAYLALPLFLLLLVLLLL